MSLICQLTSEDIKHHFASPSASYDASTFNAMILDENPFTCHAKKKTKMSQFYWLFSSDIVAVKGLSNMEEEEGKDEQNEETGGRKK